MSIAENMLNISKQKNKSKENIFNRSEMGGFSMPERSFTMAEKIECVGDDIISYYLHRQIYVLDKVQAKQSECG